MRRILAVFLIGLFVFSGIFAAMPSRAQSQNANIGYTSSDTGQGNLVIYNDYWATRDSHYGDTVTFWVEVYTAKGGNYTWRLPEFFPITDSDGTSHDARNPLLSIFHRAEVRRDGTPLGNLIANATHSSAIVEVNENSRTTFDWTLSLETLNDLERGLVDDMVRRNHEIEGSSSFDADEVHGALEFIPASDECSAGNQSTAQTCLKSGVRFLLFFDVNRDPWNLQFTPTVKPHANVDDHGCYSETILNYRSNTPWRAHMSGTGDFEDSTVELFIDKSTQHAMQVDVQFGDVPERYTPALWTHDMGTLLVELPAGTHDVILSTCWFDESKGLMGTWSIADSRGRMHADIPFSVMGAPDSTSSLTSVIASVVGIIILCVVGYFGFHFTKPIVKKLQKQRRQKTTRSKKPKNGKDDLVRL